MKILLDTHDWLWLVSEPSKIGNHLHRALADAANELWLSPISSWEILVLAHKGRIRLNKEAGIWVSAASAPFHEEIGRAHV